MIEMKIFISYASKDLQRFAIPKVSQLLEQQDEIEQVFYWDRDSNFQQSIVKYMEDSIQVSDVIIVVCSEFANDSGPVQQEIDMAVYLNKRIIPIFKDMSEVRLSLRPKRGVKFIDTNFDAFFNELLSVLTEKAQIKEDFEQIKNFVKSNV